MDLNRYLPAVVTTLLVLAVWGTIGLLALRWTKSDNARLWIRRALLVVLLACVGGLIAYWSSTWVVEGPPRHAIDRSLQEQQQRELQQRVQRGGH